MKTKFTSNHEGQEVQLAIIHPTNDVLNKANVIQNKVFKEAVNGGAMLGVALEKIMRDQGLWDDTKQELLQELGKQINDYRYQLERGGISKARGKEIALEVIKCIDKQRELLSDRSAYNSRTADGLAENARFNYLVSACTVYNDSGERVFSSLSDYESKSYTQLGADAAKCFAEVMYGFNNLNEANNIEYKRLKEWGCVNDKLQFVNQDGKLVDKNGKLIDENGRYVNEEGKFVDVNGHLIDEDGKLIVEELPFTE